MPCCRRRRTSRSCTPSSTGGDPGETAELFATLYDLALDRNDVVAVTAREVGELVGFGYGHRWLWAEQNDDWSGELAAQLGDDAHRLEQAFAVQLLAVHPKFTHRGLGFELLKQLMVASGSAGALAPAGGLRHPRAAALPAHGLPAAGRRRHRSSFTAEQDR